MASEVPARTVVVTTRWMLVLVALSALASAAAAATVGDRAILTASLVLAVACVARLPAGAAASPTSALRRRLTARSGS